MRRIATLLGAVAAAATMALLPAAQALAASGLLVIDGRAYVNPPAACYESNWHQLQIANHTDEDVLVYSSQDCQGPILAVVHPHDSGTYSAGASVYVAR